MMAAGSPAPERGFSKPNQTTTMTHETLKAAFLQGGEREAASLLGEMMRTAVRAALFDAMSDEVDALCGPRYRPSPDAGCRRAGSEDGIAYIDGERKRIRRPRMRDGDGEVTRGGVEPAGPLRGGRGGGVRRGDDTGRGPQGETGGEQERGGQDVGGEGP